MQWEKMLWMPKVLLRDGFTEAMQGYRETKEFLLQEQIKTTLENGSDYRKTLKIIKIHNSSPYFSQTQTVRVLKYTFVFVFIFFLEKRLTLLVSL